MSTKKMCKGPGGVRYISGVPVQVAVGEGPHPENSRSLWRLDGGRIQRVSGDSHVGDVTLDVLVCPPDMTPQTGDFTNPPEGTWLGEASDKTGWGRRGQETETVLPQDQRQAAALLETFEVNMKGPKSFNKTLREKLVELGGEDPIERTPYIFNARTLGLAGTVAGALGRGDIPALYLGGPPGTGKTAFGEAFAGITGGTVFEVRITSETKPSDLTAPPDLTAMVRGEGAMMQGGVWQAFAHSQDPENGPAILIVDEVDKADPHFVDSLLRLMETFEFEVPTDVDIGIGGVEDGVVRARRGNLVVIFTSNNTKEMSSAFQQRCSAGVANLEYPTRKEMRARARSIIKRRLEHHEEVPDALIDLTVSISEKLREVLEGGATDSFARKRLREQLPTVRDVANLCLNLHALSETGYLDAEQALASAADLFFKRDPSAVVEETFGLALPLGDGTRSEKSAALLYLLDLHEKQQALQRARRKDGGMPSVNTGQWLQEVLGNGGLYRAGALPNGVGRHLVGASRRRGGTPKA